MPDPARIQRIAESDGLCPRCIRGGPSAPTPAIHIEAVRTLLQMGATPYIHSGQPNQHRVILFYGRHVLPHLRPAIQSSYRHWSGTSAKRRGRHRKVRCAAACAGWLKSRLKNIGQGPPQIRFRFQRGSPVSASAGRTLNAFYSRDGPACRRRSNVGRFRRLNGERLRAV